MLFKHIKLHELYEDETNKTVEFILVGSINPEFQSMHRNLYLEIQQFYKINTLKKDIDWPSRFNSSNIHFNYKLIIASIDNKRMGVYLSNPKYKDEFTLFGYVPIKIADILRNHLDIFYNGRIKSVHAVSKTNSKTVCYTKVIFNYKFYKEENILINRLERILE